MNRGQACFTEKDHLGTITVQKKSSEKLGYCAQLGMVINNPVTVQ
jgi:hypothetical protein